MAFFKTNYFRRGRVLIKLNNTGIDWLTGQLFSRFFFVQTNLKFRFLLPFLNHETPVDFKEYTFRFRHGWQTLEQGRDDRPPCCPPGKEPLDATPGRSVGVLQGVFALDPVFIRWRWASRPFDCHDGGCSYYVLCFLPRRLPFGGFRFFELPGLQDVVEPWTKDCQDLEDHYSERPFRGWGHAEPDGPKVWRDPICNLMAWRLSGWMCRSPTVDFWWCSRCLGGRPGLPGLLQEGYVCGWKAGWGIMDATDSSTWPSVLEGKKVLRWFWWLGELIAIDVTIQHRLTLERTFSERTLIALISDIPNLRFL